MESIYVPRQPEETDPFHPLGFEQDGHNSVESLTHLDSDPKLKERGVDEARQEVDRVYSQVNKLPSEVNDNVFPANTETTDRKKDLKLKVTVRNASIDDIERIVDLDLQMFQGAYGDKPPSRDALRHMFSRRLSNIQGNRGSMKVCEVNGKVEAFATVFRTDRPWTTFKSWEESTADGTLNDRTSPGGKYAYIANMTVASKGSAVRARERLSAHLMAVMVEQGVPYGHFVSRMPQFANWLKGRGVDVSHCDDSQIDALAVEYSELRRPVKRAPKTTLRTVVDVVLRRKDNQTVPYDYELRVYEKNKQFERGRLTKGSFSDPESLNYGVLFRVKIPGASQPKLIRKLIGLGLKIIGNNQKMAAKVF